MSLGSSLVQYSIASLEVNGGGDFGPTQKNMSSPDHTHNQHFRQGFKSTINSAVMRCRVVEWLLHIDDLGSDGPLYSRCDVTLQS